MRGGDNLTGELFSYVDLEARVRRDHPLRAIRVIVNEALVALEREFAALYSPLGRPSIPPEKLLRAIASSPWAGPAPHSDGLLVDACLTLAAGHAERVAALHIDANFGINKDTSNFMFQCGPGSEVRLTDSGGAKKRTSESPHWQLSWDCCFDAFEPVSVPGGQARRHASLKTP